MSTNRQQQARVLRTFRKVHRWTGAALFILFFLISISGLLLGWKKNSGGYILADTEKGSSTDLSKWVSFDSLETQAVFYLHQEVDSTLSGEIDRFDVRPDKGTVKIRFKDHYWGVQLDGATGKLLTVERRRSDFIESLHDGSVIDNLEIIPGGYFKLFYTSLTGLALLTFTVTGFWLWYGPKRMRRLNH
ncbi:PepSY-associated TM helix domain-containing protein [Fulvivirga sedimenti]|uniref:PepSY domain-containing protein n=1 Tax=Fulvivirga sedimenti TaxID=2879465 RepID=A0A9X1HW89_9BACT|nr:PepSY-associated TM helix domain-containing protein [Fulvivirga sedimenti]MCA6079080.1 PepSY domain-containing protein [Fulvivirga sedimenti]